MPVPITVRAIDRVLVALLPEAAGEEPGGRGSISSGERSVLAAEVLASWFGASLQFVTTDTAATDQLEGLSGSIGLRTEPVAVLPSTGFDEALSHHASHNGPSLVVAAAGTATLTCATTNQVPTFLVPPGPKRRLPSGPLVAVLPDDTPSEAALALATVWAQALDVALILVLPADQVDRPESTEIIGRLETMGLEVRPTTDSDLARVATDDDNLPLALVVPAATVATSPVVAEIHARGGNVVAAPETSTAARPHIELDELHRLASAIGTTSDDAEGLSATECATVLTDNRVGRLGYIHEEWPVVVPVNYSVHQGDIFIRAMRGGKLDAASRNDRVCFEVDSFDEAARSGTSVLIHGRLEVITDPALLQAAWDNDPSPFADSTQMLWLRLATLATTGRRIG